VMLIRSINACESEATDFFRYGVWNLIGGGLGVIVGILRRLSIPTIRTLGYGNLRLGRAGDASRVFTFLSPR